jgi:hypothetical protein
MRQSWWQKWLMKRDTKTEKKSERIGTPPNPSYKPVDNGSTVCHVWIVFARRLGLRGEVMQTTDVVDRSQPADSKSLTW